MEYDLLKLENQLCFPIYACSREIVKRYKPFLYEIGLTYTQYIVMMVLWEKEKINVKSLGEYLYLDSGTLTPLLKKLEAKGLIERTRYAKDERSLLITLTNEGEALKQQALSIPVGMARCINLSNEDSKDLHRILYKILKSE